MTRIMTFLMMALIASVIISCDKFENGVPAKELRKDFSAMNPGAKDVEWERKGNCWQVSYEIGTYPDVVEYESLYDASGDWVMTKTELRLSDVPQHIKDYLTTSSDYASASFEDREVEFYETQTEDFYRFDLVLSGREVEVDVTADGAVVPARRNLF